jgi:hypothetical protein
MAGVLGRAHRNHGDMDRLATGSFGLQRALAGAAGSR